MSICRIRSLLGATVAAGILHAAPPANDDLADARLIVPIAGSQSEFGTNLEATTETGEFAFPGLAGPTKSVWYRLKRPPFGASFTVTTDGSDFDTILSVFRGHAAGGVAELESIAGDDDSGTGQQSQLSFAVLDASQKDYFIAVDGFGGASGSIFLNLIAAPPTVQDPCPASATFPASCPEPYEEFAGGADAFDLDGHAITFVPQQVLVNGHPQTHYRYSVHRIRALPEDLSDAEPFFSSLGPVPTNGFPIFDETTATLTCSHGEISFADAGGSPMTSRVRMLVNPDTGFDYLRREHRHLSQPGKITIQIDYYVGSGIDFFGVTPDGHSVTCQAELFVDGMIRLSYLGVDATTGTVGLFCGGTFPPEDDFSAAKLTIPDVVVNESDGTADFTIGLPATQGADLDFSYATLNGTASGTSDFTPVSEPGTIAATTLTTMVAVPVTGDATPEADEYFTLRVTSPGNPDWIHGEARGWILDDLPVATSLSPRVEVAGNRVIVSPPPGDSSGIGGFRIVAVAGGTLRHPVTGSVLAAGSEISLADGAAGLLTSGPGVQLEIETFASGGGASLGSISIDIDGQSDLPVFNFSRQIVRVAEGDTAELVVEVSPPDSEATVAVEVVSATAQEGEDYHCLPAALEFENGRASVFVPVLADGISEGEEEFELHLIAPSPGTVLGPAAIATVIVADGSGALRSPDQQVLPLAGPSGRTVRVTFDPTDFGDQDLSQSWRFVGEPHWRPSDGNAWNAREGNHWIEYRPTTGVSPDFRNLAAVPGDPLFLAPRGYVHQGLYNGLVLDGIDVDFGDFERLVNWPALTSPPTGSLTVSFGGGSPAGGSWRRLGTTSWLSSGVTESDVPAGKHLIEFRDDLAGFLAPTLRTATVWSGELTSLATTYLPRPAASVLPALVPEPSVHASTGTWVNLPITAQQDKFVVSFEFKPGSGSIDTLVGLSAAPAQNYPHVSTIVRARSGVFDGWDTSGFAADEVLGYVAGEWHFVEFAVDVAAGTYDLTVMPSSGGPVAILGSAGFRAAASELRYLSMFSTQGSHKIRNLRVEELPEETGLWQRFRFPAPDGSFDLGFLMNLAGDVDFNPGTGIEVRFGLSHGAKTAPDEELAALMVGGLDNMIERFQVAVHVDLDSGDYSIEIDGTESVTGSLSGALARADHVYIRVVWDDQTPGEFGVLDTVFPPHEAEPGGTGANDPEDWVHVPIEPQIGRFSLSYEVTTIGETVGSGDLIDGIVALSDDKVTDWSDASVVLKAQLPVAGSGFWEAHTGEEPGGSFMRDNDLQVVDGRKYKVELVVDVPNQTYRASVQPDNGPPVVVMEAGTFRKSATELRYLTLRNVQGRLAVSRIRGPLPPPEEAPLQFAGQIESGKGFGSGVVVADHVVLTSARLIFDVETLSFVPDIVWRLPVGGSTAVPDANRPSGALLVTGYAAARLAQGGGAADPFDVAALAFRPVNLPDHDNAPGLGGYSGFRIDDGSAPWSAGGLTRTLVSFPMSGIAAADRGRMHQSGLGGVSFGSVATHLHQVASGLETPPGSEGAPLFVEQADGRHFPAAICIGAASGAPRFRAIDARVASAIHQANGFQRQPDYLQELNKGGVWYIPTTMAGSTDPNRGHIFSNALPPSSAWTLFHSGYDSETPAAGGDALSVEPGSYEVKFGDPPDGYDWAAEFQNWDAQNDVLRKRVSAGTEWHLPAVYVLNAPTSFELWQELHFSESERTQSAVAEPEEQTPWLGVENVIAFAFDFDPKGTSTHPADPDAMTPGFPILRTIGGTPYLEFLRRQDGNLSHLVESGGNLATWPGSLDVTYPLPLYVEAENIGPGGIWDHVRIPLSDLTGGGSERKFVRVRVEIVPPD